ncbi:MAG: hypothetical protein C0602_12250 [Denitrovibrio sp.]|nr:MAG: hypothetical protein C0602_12250 [Denitrovibrio sp.]
MRKTLVIFLLLSFLVHLFLVNQVVLTPDKKPENEPVSVSIIPKKKQDKLTEKPETKAEEKTETKKQQKVYEDVPLNEELETKLDQSAPVPDVGNDSKKKSEKPEQTEQPDKQPEKKTESDKNEIDKSSEKVEVPKVTAPEKKLSKKQLREKLSPDDIIQKYADGGGMPDGEDYVSMQYVKLRYQSYFHKFARRLYQVWIYPSAAAMRGEQGTVRISFSISKDGMISGIRVVQSSGYPDLDREAVTALKKTAGVPLPESYELNFLKVDAFFKYVMNEGFYVY